MKLLLDENLPHDFRHLLSGHDVFTADFMDWAGVANGALLAKAAAEGFDAVITLDTGIEYQQNLATLPCSVVILQAESNRLRHLRPLVPAVLAALTALETSALVRIGR